jgi:hypothetical protein
VLRTQITGSLHPPMLRCTEEQSRHASTLCTLSVLTSLLVYARPDGHLILIFMCPLDYTLFKKKNVMTFFSEGTSARLS